MPSLLGWWDAVGCKEGELRCVIVFVLWFGEIYILCLEEEEVTAM